MKYLPLALVCLFFQACQSTEPKESQLPNILFLLADDLGYADLGCYGGDINTPNIDQLAARGLRFSRFHTAPLCSPTRAMVLSGNDNHIAGIGRQGRVTSHFGYEGRLSDRVAIIPELLREKGYHTYISGKWHLGADSIYDPTQRGFEHAFVNSISSGNHYNDVGMFASTPVSPYREDGVSVTWPEGAYSTDLFTDKLIEYIGRHQEDTQPFFAFAAYTSPHWPLQVDEEYWKKYEGRYDAGYDVLKAERFQSLIKAGLIPEDAVLPENHRRVKPWDSLSTEQQKIEARKMELYAGMVDNLDENIGRLFQYLKDIGVYENTLIVFMSDNGAAAEDFYYTNGYKDFLQANYTDAYGSMGKAESFISYGPQWAEAGSSPFRYFKGETTEGAMIAPLLIAGPGVERAGETYDGFSTLMDIAPTFYEFAGVNYPDSFQNRQIYPLKGKSLQDLLEGKSNLVHDENYVFGLEHGGRAQIRKGDWKITSTERPFAEEKFQLFNLKEDLAEQYDLKEEYPDKYAELLAEWKKFRTEIKAQFPAPKRGT